MTAQSAKEGAEQGADEDRKGDIQDSTSTARRSQPRRNAPASADRADETQSGEQVSAVRDLSNQYEIAVLYHPDLEMDLEKATAKVEEIIADSGGKISKTDNWGKRKLAYPIKKQDFAIYVFYNVEMPANSVQKIEQTFNITDEVIRFLITKRDLKAEAKAEQQRADKAKKAAERRETDETAENAEDSDEE